MDSKKLFISFLLILLCTSSLYAQLAKIPFEFDGKHLFIKVKTKNSDSLRFVFDTGTTGATIDSTAARKVNIFDDTLTKVLVNGSGGSQINSMALNQSLEFGGLKLNSLNLVLSDLSSLSSALGIKIDGLVGYEILNIFVAQIDFERKLISFYQDIKSVDTLGYTSIDFQFNKNVLIPRFPISITLKNGESFTGRVMFDTGNAFPLLVSTPFSKYHNFRIKIGESGIALGRGAHATTTDQIAVIDNMKFNGFKFGEMSIRLTVNEQAEPRDGYLGILGMPIIRRFHVILDYNNKKIYLKPNMNYNEPFLLEKIPGGLTSASKSFMENNKRKPNIITTPSGLQYKIIHKGKGPIPTMSNKVELHYSAKLLNGQKLWSTYDHNKPWIHHLDKALPGVAEAVIKMPVGSKWMLYIPPALAFGDQGDSEVAPGELLIYELEVLSIQN